MSERPIAVRREQYQYALADALRSIVTALARRPEVRRAILFGSYAEGRRDLFTDLDILSIMESPLDFVIRTAEMHQYLSGGVDMDLLLYTPEELERNKDRGFNRQVLERGKLIYKAQTA